MNFRKKASQILLAIIVTLPFLTPSNAQAQVTDLQLIKLRESIRSWANTLVCDNMTPTKNSPQECHKPGGSNGVGDSVIFSSILCYSGEIWACRNIEFSQDLTGAMWRSAQRQREQYDDKNDPKYLPRFSYDQLLGVLLFLVTEYKRGNVTKVRDFGKKMAGWIDRNKYLNHFFICPVEGHSIDGTLKEKVQAYGKRLGTEIDVCSIELYNRSRLIRHVFDYIGVDSPQRISNDGGLFGGGTKYRLGDGLEPTLTLGALSTKCFFSPGFQCHLATLASLILQETNASGSIIPVNGSFSQNPFSLWVANGRQSNDEIRRLTYEKCSVASEPNNYTTPGEKQWSWERVDSERAWLPNGNTSGAVGWDCVAIINLITDGQKNASRRAAEKTTPSPVFFSDVTYHTIPPELQEVEFCVPVDSRLGWKTFAGIKPGLSLAGVASVTNSWSVDDKTFPRVGPKGHLEPNLNEQFKYDRRFPYGALLMVVPGQGYTWVEGQKRFSQPITDDRVTLRINEADNNLADNGGELTVCFGNENVMKKVNITPPDSEKTRMHWEMSSTNGRPGTITRTSVDAISSSWENKDATNTYKFKSGFGTSNPVGLYDSSRDLYVRLYDDGRSYWRPGTSGTWNRGVDGRWVKPTRFVNAWTDTCLASRGNSKANNNPVVISNCSISTVPTNGMWYFVGDKEAMTPDVMWYVTSNGEIRNVWTNTCLASRGNSKAIDNPVVVSKCTGAPNTLWKAASNGEIRNVLTDTCLASLGNSKAVNNPVVVAACSGASNILWK